MKKVECRHGCSGDAQGKNIKAMEGVLILLRGILFFALEIFRQTIQNRIPVHCRFESWFMNGIITNQNKSSIFNPHETHFTVYNLFDGTRQSAFCSDACGTNFKLHQLNNLIVNGSSNGHEWMSKRRKQNFELCVFLMDCLYWLCVWLLTVNLLDSRSVMGDLGWVAYPKNGVSVTITQIIFLLFILKLSLITVTVCSSSYGMPSWLSKQL